MPPQPLQGEWEVRPLDSHHDRAAFSCGDDRISDFLKKHASQSMKRKTAVIWILSKKGENKTLGFYSLSNTLIDVGTLPAEIIKKIKFDKAGATLLGQFGNDESVQNCGYGRLLHMHALRKAWMASKDVASVGVILDARTDAAKKFWNKCEYIALPETSDGSQKFFLPMTYIEDLFKET